METGGADKGPKIVKRKNVRVQFTVKPEVWDTVLTCAEGRQGLLMLNQDPTAVARRLFEFGVEFFKEHGPIETRREFDRMMGWDRDHEELLRRCEASEKERRRHGMKVAPLESDSAPAS